MTPAEIQELREKHVAYGGYCSLCAEWNDVLDSHLQSRHPCDVILVLDAYEELVARTDSEQITTNLAPEAPESVQP